MLPAVMTDMLGDPATFEHMQRVAKLFSAAELVPAHLRGKVADCFIALNIARRLGEDPIMVMQNIYFVSGRAGWSTQYMIARANRSGVFRDRISWTEEGAGDALKVTAFATLQTGQVVSVATTMKMAKAEGWTKNTKYNTMPEHMLRWRSATMLIRLYAPDVMMGMNTTDELVDMGVMRAGADGVYRPAERPASKLDAMEAAIEGQAALDDVTQEDPGIDADAGSQEPETVDAETGEVLPAEPAVVAPFPLPLKPDGKTPDGAALVKAINDELALATAAEHVDAIERRALLALEDRRVASLGNAVKLAIAKRRAALASEAA